MPFASFRVWIRHSFPIDWMDLFHYQRKPFWSRGTTIPGIVLLLAGSGVLISMLFGVASELKIWLVGLGSIVIGGAILTTFSGIEIDFDQARFRRFDRFAGWKFGDWEPLPHIEKIDIIQHEYRSQNIPNGVTPTLSGTVLVHKVVLLSSTEVVLSLDYQSQKRASKAFEEIQKALQL